VYRGGSWGYYPQFCRAAFRDRGTPSVRNDDLGFRLARS
jgi:formylglycine-generating enzyme required for sulfatase activity